jgi:hypothetical protein
MYSGIARAPPSEDTLPKHVRDGGAILRRRLMDAGKTLGRAKLKALLLEMLDEYG